MRNIIDYLYESQVRENLVTLRKFIEWYTGEKTTRISSSLLEDLGWEHLAEEFDMNLSNLAMLLDKNLDNTFKFKQTKQDRSILIEFTIEGNKFQINALDFYGESKNSNHWDYRLERL